MTTHRQTQQPEYQRNTEPHGAGNGTRVFLLKNKNRFF